MDDDQVCATCKWWEQSEDMYWPSAREIVDASALDSERGWHPCQKTIPIEVMETTPTNQEPITISRPTRAIVSSGCMDEGTPSVYDALWTAPDFGCNQWEKKP